MTSARQRAETHFTPGHHRVRGPGQVPGGVALGGQDEGRKAEAGDAPGLGEDVAGSDDHDAAAARATVLRKAAVVREAEEAEDLTSETDRALLDSAEEHFRRGDPARAVRAYDAYLGRHPDDVVAWNNRGVVLDASGDHASATESYRRAVELQPSYEVAWCNRGNSYTYMGEHEEAMRNYLQSIQVNRRYRMAYDYLVQLLRSKGEPRDVLRRLVELEQQIGETAYFKYHQALLLDELGRHRRAVRLYERALQLEDGDPEIWKALGNARFNLEELDLAIEAYDQALEIDIENEEVWNNRGFTFFSAGFTGVAVDCFKQAVRINPAYKHAWYNLGYAYHQMDRLEEAIAAYTRAIDIDDEDEILLNNRGNAEYNLGNYLESIPWFERAVAVNPRYDIAWNNIGNALNRSGRDEEAIPYHLKTLKINPKFDYAMYAMGESKHALGDHEEALEWLDKSLEQNPNYDHTWLLKAEVLEELGRPDEALEAVENAIRLNADFDEAHFLRASLLEELGRPREARSAYEDALEAVTRSITSRPAQGRMWERKGRMLAELGDLGEAVRCYDTALLMPRTSMSAREARADVLMRSHRYREAMESLQGLEGEETPDPTDLRLRMAAALAEMGRVEEVRQELGDLLRAPEASGGPVVDVDAPSDDPRAPTEAGEGKDASPDEPLMPYVPSHPEPREPTDEDRARALHLLGRAQYMAGDAVAAAESLRAAAGTVEDLPGLQLDLGNALCEAGATGDALAAFEMAVAHDLDDEAPRALAGCCHLEVGNAKEADRAFEGALGIAPDYALAWLGKGRALMAMGRHRRALGYLREAVRLDPRCAEGRLALAEAYASLERREEAVREARRARVLDPDDGRAVEVLRRQGAEPLAADGEAESTDGTGSPTLTTRPPQAPPMR